VGTGPTNGCGSPYTPASGGAHTPTAAQCAAAIAYIQSRVQPQLIPRTADVNLLFGKIDYQISERHRWTTEINYLDFRSPNGIQTQAAISSGAAIGGNANTNVFDRTVKSSLNSILSPETVNELRFGIFKDRQYDPASPSLLPSIGPVNLSLGSLSNLGYPTGYPRTLPSELRFEVSDTLSWTHGQHSMKFGVDYAHLEDYINQLSNRYGTYSYTTLSAFALDFSGNTQPLKDWSRYSQTFGNPVVDLNFNEISLFAQDEWHVTPKLTLSPGARYEFTTIPQPTQVNPNFSQTGFIPNTKLNLAPRFGLAYQWNDKTVFRAGYGLFFNRYISAAIESLFLSNGLYQPAYTLNNTGPQFAAQQAAGPVFPAFLGAAPNVTGSANLDIADPNWRNSYAQQGTAAVERQLGRDTGLTVSYVWSRSLHIASAFDANAAPPTSSYTYTILDNTGNPVGAYTTPIYTARLNPAYGKIIQLTSNANSYYNGLVVQLQKRYSGWLQGNLSYTWSHTIDYDIGGAAGNTAGASGILYAPSFPTSVFNGDERNEKGSAATDERHRLVLSGVVDPKFTHGDSWADKYLINGWQLSAISTFGSSFPLAPTMNVIAAPSGLLSSSTLNGLGGATRVPFESISALNVAPVYRTDARLSHIWPIGERFRLTLLFEAQNVFNHFILEGASPRNTVQYNTQAYHGGVALVPNPTYGAATQTQAPPDGTTSRRAQAALRFEW
ncbi:MAG: TonB-dependent receptor, partial [Acidobacteriaceae bacterium]|nr:TonB-dependent receptor [Acidobacteriaceae bacterium]